MRILEIAPYMTCNEVSLLSQCKAGFGYMVYDIAHSLSKKSEVESFLYNYRYNEFHHGELFFISSSFSLFFKGILTCSNPLIPLKLWLRYKMQFRTLIRMIYVWLLSGYLFKVIKERGYDIVHIHGCGFADEILMDVCRRANQKFIVTLHGLNSFSESVSMEPAGKKYERDFLQRVVKGEFPITVISTGIRRTIENTYGKKDIPNLYVVCNAFSFNESRGGVILDVRKKYGIAPESMVVLYVGNLCRRKNQGQLISAFALLPKSLAENTFVLFLGKRLEEEYSIEALAEGNEFCNHFIECGNVDKELMPAYYSQSNAVALLSVSEGFGLGLIEGMHYGLPCISFDDIDAFNDIYDSSAMVGISDHDDSSVARGIQQLLTKQWSKEKIVEASKKFEPDKMVANYLLCFRKEIT